MAQRFDQHCDGTSGDQLSAPAFVDVDDDRATALPRRAAGGADMCTRRMARRQPDDYGCDAAAAALAGGLSRSECAAIRPGDTGAQNEIPGGGVRRYVG